MNLVANEWMKLFKRASTYIMLAFVVIIVIGVGSIIKYSEVKSSEETSVNWEVQMKENLVFSKQELESIKDDKDMATYRESLERNIAIDEYRLEHNIPPSDAEDKNVWLFLNDMVSVIDFLSIFTIIVAAGIVANEFSNGTIKLLLIRPVSRVKILVSKYVSVMLFSALLVGLAFILSFIVGVLLFGFGDVGPELLYRDGTVIEMNRLTYAMLYFSLSSVGLIMLTTMAFMISTAFRNSSLAIGISIFLLLMGSAFTALLAMVFDGVKYILFANLDLMGYITGNQVFDFDGGSLTFSLVILAVYFVLFHIIAFLFFTKRDVAA